MFSCISNFRYYYSPKEARLRKEMRVLNVRVLSNEGNKNNDNLSVKTAPKKKSEENVIFFDINANHN